jgi:hypothetical protein
MIHRGRIIANASPQEFRRLDDPRVQQFIHGRAQGPLSEDEPSLSQPSLPQPPLSQSPSQPPGERGPEKRKGPAAGPETL